MQNRSYQIIPFGRGETTAAYCTMCAEGELGESLLRDGFAKRRFCEFIAKLVLERHSKGKSLDSIVNALTLVDCSNMSAAKQALASCQLQWEAVDKDGNSILDNEGNPTWIPQKDCRSIEAYWKAMDGAKPAANLSDLKD